MPELTIFKTMSATKLSGKIDDYFAKMKKQKTVPSITGLALHLNCTRQNIVDYGKTDEYADIISRAKLRCENVLEERMINGTPPTGIIFILKNNYGWQDKVKIDQTLTGTISLATLFDRAAQQKVLEGKKQEIVDGEIIETPTEESLFDGFGLDSHESESKHGDSIEVDSSEGSSLSNDQAPDQLPDELF